MDRLVTAARPNARPIGRDEQRPYWLTARAARLLGHQVPADIPDDEAITFTSAGAA